jgi:hypothetical protein
VSRTTKDRLYTHSFEIAASIVAILVAIAYWTHPIGTAVRSPLHGKYHSWQYVWVVLYIIGGLLDLTGLLRGKVNIRIGGLLFLSTGWGLQFVAAVSNDLEWRTFSYLAWSAACLLKVIMLYRVHFKGRSFQL